MTSPWIVGITLAVMCFPFYVYFVCKFGASGFYRGIQRAKRNLGGRYDEKRKETRTPSSLGPDKSRE
jgi:hypothetical protein